MNDSLTQIPDPTTNAHRVCLKLLIELHTERSDL